jgi:hypothetical protein
MDVAPGASHAEVKQQRREFTGIFEVGVGALRSKSIGKKGGSLRTAALKNSQLRRLVTDLLLEKIKLEEAVQRQNFYGVTGTGRASR